MGSQAGPDAGSPNAILDRYLDVGAEGWLDRAEGLIDLIRPIGASPTAAIETAAAIDSFAPSLMPRSSLHQGVVTGLSVLAARGVGNVVEAATRRLVSDRSQLAVRLAARGIVAGAGEALARLPEQPDESTARASVRAGGRMLRTGAIGGLAFDVGSALEQRIRRGDRGRLATMMMGTVGAAGAVYWARSNLRTRKAAIDRGPKAPELSETRSLVAGAVVLAVGNGIGIAARTTHRGIRYYLGDGVTKRPLALALNGALWAGLGTGLYWAGISKVGRANEKVDPGYDTPPSTSRVSGSPDSILPFEDLGQQGRRFVTDVLTDDLIADTMGESVAAEPIRVFVGFNSEPVYFTGRAELAMEELDRTGAFDRSNLLLVSPTGTGWVDHTMIEAAEFLTKGDIATCCIQYGRYPSFLSVQKVALGRRQFRLLLWAVKERLRSVPPEKRPRVFVFGESLGAWASSDVVMYQGISGFDHYGIDKALWVGMPYLAKWSKEGMNNPGPGTPPGSCGVFDHHDQLAALSDEQRKQLRAVLLSHDNDPITRLGPRIIVKCPDWLGDGDRGRGVPANARWVPVITFLQTLIDAANAMQNIPGEFRSFGHDYRADMAAFVNDAFGFGATAEQVDAINDALSRLEIERSHRIKGETEERQAAPKSPQQLVDEADAKTLVPLRNRQTDGARWLGGRASDTVGRG